MGGPADGDSHGIKSGFLDEAQVFVLDPVAPGAFAGRFQAVTKADAAADGTIQCGCVLGIGGLWLGGVEVADEQ